MSAAGNLVFNGGTLAYTGPTNKTDLGMTIGANGGGVSVSSNLTLNGLISGKATFSKGGAGNLTLNYTTYGLTNVVVNAGTLSLTTGGDAANDFYDQVFTNNPTRLIANPGSACHQYRPCLGIRQRVWEQCAFRNFMGPRLR